VSREASGFADRKHVMTDGFKGFPGRRTPQEFVNFPVSHGQFHDPRFTISLAGWPEHGEIIFGSSVRSHTIPDRETEEDGRIGLFVGFLHCFTSRMVGYFSKHNAVCEFTHF
jgi:hypothetical protein